MDSQLQLLAKWIAESLSHLQSEFAKLQTGRASAALVESVPVEAYGQMQPLKALAGISVQDARTLVIQPWDRGILADVEKALIKANLGTQPVNEGTIIRIVLPPMTEERRMQLKKLVHELAENARVSVRQKRQEVHTNAKRDKERTEDEHRNFEEEINEMVKKANAEIEGMAKRKEEEVMRV